MTSPRRRWFQFGLGAIFVVVTVVALTAGWVAYQFRWIHQRHSLLNEPGVRRANAGFEVEINTPWSLAVLGEKGVEALDIPESELKRAHDLFPEATLKVRPGE